MSLPFISNKFEKRIGSLGTATTRIYYVLSLNGQQLFSYYDSSPDNVTIELKFRQLGSDLRVYPYGDSIAKSLLSSIYVAAYPLNPSLRPILEKKINDYIQLSTSIGNQNHANNTVKVLYYELYYGQNSMNHVSRVYYAV